MYISFKIKIQFNGNFTKNKTIIKTSIINTPIFLNKNYEATKIFEGIEIIIFLLIIF